MALEYLYDGYHNMMDWPHMVSMLPWAGLALLILVSTAVIIYLIVRQYNSKKDQRVFKNSTLIQPTEQKSNNIDQQTLKTPPETDTKLYCPNCGTKVYSGTLFCPNCGASIDE